jgi:hypothetical protein
MIGLVIVSAQERAYSVHLTRQQNGEWTQNGQVRARTYKGGNCAVADVCATRHALDRGVQ